MKINYIYYTIYVYIIFTNTIYIIKIGFRNVVMQQVGAWKCNSVLLQTDKKQSTGGGGQMGS